MCDVIGKRKDSWNSATISNEDRQSSWLRGIARGVVYGKLEYVLLVIAGGFVLGVLVGAIMRSM